MFHQIRIIQITDINAAHRYRTIRYVPEACDQIANRAFPTAGFSDQCRYGSRLDRHGYMIDCLHSLLVPKGHVIQADFGIFRDVKLLPLRQRLFVQDVVDGNKGCVCKHKIGRGMHELCQNGCYQGNQNRKE